MSRAGRDSISFSSLSVVPVTAEWTISTRAPVSRRVRVICAMLRQLASEETLVPPNFRTTHCGKLRATMRCLAKGCSAGMCLRRRDKGSGAAPGCTRYSSSSKMSRRSFSSLRSASTSSSLLHAALPFLPCVAYAFVHAVQNAVVIGTVFGCVIEEFVVQIEVFVISL